MNTSKLSAVAVLVAALSLFACGEQVVPTQQLKDAVPRLEVPADSRRVVTVIGQDPPSDAPPEYQSYTWINVIADAGWIDANTSYGQSIVQYGANNATADVKLTIRNASGAIIGSNSGHAAESWVFPGEHTLRVSTNAFVTPTCGSVAQAQASGTAFNTWLNTLQNTVRWGNQAQSDTKSASQASCPPPPTCQDAKATNYGGPLPCTYSSGSAPIPPSGNNPPGTYYPPPYYPTGSPGHWECTTWNTGTPYETRYCNWIAGSYDRLSSPRIALSRLATAGTPARAQSSADLPSVFVIVSDQVPADAIAVVERHKTGPFKNVLLVPSSSVRPAVFVAAMQALYDSRDKDGDAPAKELSITLRGTILDQQIPSTDRDYAAGFTAQISSAKKGNASAYGTLPIVEFKLGAKR
ncbi:MAG TPA: hypothetical protein VF461_13060 [Gemmatimonadaceae bacterium]